jgi:hypothetical protein
MTTATANRRQQPLPGRRNRLVNNRQPPDRQPVNAPTGLIRTSLAEVATAHVPPGQIRRGPVPCRERWTLTGTERRDTATHRAIRDDPTIMLKHRRPDHRGGVKRANGRVNPIARRAEAGCAASGYRHWALSISLPLTANARSGPEERVSGLSSAGPMRISLLSKLRPGCAACICTATDLAPVARAPLSATSASPTRPSPQSHSSRAGNSGWLALRRLCVQVACE